MIKKMNDEVLLTHVKKLAAEERRATLALIEGLAEVEYRRLYAARGFSSLWEYATQELRLSKGAAHRRIRAARLLVKAPGAKESLANGNLSLSNAACVQGFIQNEKKQGRTPDAMKLVQAVQDLSQPDCEAKLFEFSPTSTPPPKRDGNRIVSAKKDRELKFVVSDELFEKLERIKGLIAHARPNASLADLLEYLATEQLSRLEKKKGIGQDLDSIVTSAAKVTPLPKGKRVYLPAPLRKAIGCRSGGRCEYVHEGKRCTSTYYLQADHIIPLARGGANELSNLRLLCFNHNQQQAREKLVPTPPTAPTRERSRITVFSAAPPRAHFPSSTNPAA